MTAYVFLGPTLPREAAHDLLDAVVLPPASQGDVYRVARRRPSLIGIVDGTFERMPSVWHKEILWALDQGIPVLGAASMGALRAAELEAFGMEGVGEVFASFRDGVLEDDDEVAVAHGLAEVGFRPLSEAMVNIRATVAAAVAAGVVDEATGGALVAVAKARFYPERHYPTMLADAVAAGVDADAVAAFEAFLAAGRIDRKREDAVAMLARMRERLTAGETTVTTRFTFQHTSVWVAAARSAGRLRLPEATPTEVVTTDDLIDELRLDPARYREVESRAAARLTAEVIASLEGVRPSAEQVWATTEVFRAEQGVDDPEAAARWLADNDLTNHDAHQLMHRETLVGWTRRNGVHDVIETIPDQLRVDGDYAQLAERVAAKRARMAAAGVDEASLAELGLDETGLYAWYFGQVLGIEVPDDLDAFCAAHGYLDAVHLRRVLTMEYADATRCRPHTVQAAG